MEAAEIYTMMSANQRSVKLFSQSGKYIALDHRILTHNKQCPIPYPIHQFHHGGRCVRTLSSLRVGVSSCTCVHANTRALRTPSAPKHTPFLPLFLLLTFLSFLFFCSSSFTQANHGTVNSHTRGRQRTSDHALHVQRCAFSVRQWEQ